MIRFSLHCDNAHEFDAWFRSNEDFDEQKKSGLLSCPFCHSTSIEKQLMAPAVSTARKREKQVGLGLEAEQQKMLSALREVTKKVRKEAEYVGDRFAEEARRIHFKEVEERAIYGEASVKEVSSLVEDGIPVVPLPSLPEDEN